MVISGKLIEVCENSPGQLEARWAFVPVPSAGEASGGSGIFEDVIVHHGSDKRPSSQPASWSLRPNLRYRGLREVFERLAQPFKPIV
jgi:hypothetical protein